MIVYSTYCVYMDTDVTLGPQSPSLWEPTANSGGDRSADNKHIHIQHTRRARHTRLITIKPDQPHIRMSCGDRTRAVFEHVGPADLRRIRTCSNKTNVASRSPGAQRHLANESVLQQMKEVLFIAALKGPQNTPSTCGINSVVNITALHLACFTQHCICLQHKCFNQ